MLCKMHNTQKIYVGNTNKKDLKKNNNKNSETSDSTIAVYFFLILFLSFYFFLCCQHKFKIIMYLVFKFKFPNISLKNIQRKSHKITKNQQRIRGKKYTNQEKGILHQSTSVHITPLPLKTPRFLRFAAPQKLQKIYDVIKTLDPPSLSSLTVIKVRNPPSPLADDVICGRPPKHFEVLKHSTIQLHEHSLKQ